MSVLMDRTVTEDFSEAIKREWHQRGTRYGIHMESDGLLAGGEPGVQLTWMDAKIGDWVVTPRSGKAVEINALWYNALVIYERLLNKVARKEEAETYQALSKMVIKHFAQVFWNEKDGCLFDVVDSDQRDSAIRPNQILAISLPFALLGRNKARQVLNVVEDLLDAGPGESD